MGNETRVREKEEESASPSLVHGLVYIHIGAQKINFNLKSLAAVREGQRCRRFGRKVLCHLTYSGAPL